MTVFATTEPLCSAREGAVELVISPRNRDLGGFNVRRVLPSPDRKTVGPFIFFDEMGPAQFAPGTGINVRPHPHIGLATVTFLFEGQILHRDSLGYVQPIEPGAINLMTAGRGIVHSERTAPELERDGQSLHGIQTWMALPEDKQEIDPAFVHYPAEDLPTLVEGGCATTVIIGSAYGLTSPVEVHAETIYADHRLDAGAQIKLPSETVERAIYVVSGSVAIDECDLDRGTMGILSSGSAAMTAREQSHVMLIGGAPIGNRHIWWNFVHSSRNRIESAKKQWANGAFQTVPGDDEFIPLPED